MADNFEEQNIKLKFDTNAKQVLGDTNKLGASIEHATDAVNENTTAVGKETEVYKTFKTQLREANAELKKQIQLTGETSQETIKAAKAVANLKDQMEFASDIANKFNPDQKMKALGAATQIAGTGLQGVTAGMALFGGESEDTQKQLLKVQAAMAFSDAISNLSNLGDQYKVFKAVVIDTYNKIIAKKAADKLATDAGTASQLKQNLAVLANPYVIATVALTALTVGIYAWVNASSEAKKQEEKTANAVKLNAKETDKLKESIENASSSAKTSNDIEVLRARAYGATEEEIRKLIKRQKELSILTAGDDASNAYDNLVKANATVLKATKSGNKELLKEAEENQKSAQDLYKKANEDYNNAIIDDVKFGLESQIEINAKAKENSNKAIEQRRQARDKRKEEAEKEKKEANELAESRGENARQEYENLQKIISDAKKANEDSLKTENQLKVESENARFEAEKQRLLDANLSIEEITIEHKRKLSELNNEFFAGEADKAKTAGDKEIEIEEKVAEAKRNIRDKTMQVIADGVELLKTLFGKNKAVQRGALIAEGAVSIAKIIQNTQAGNAVAVASPLNAVDPTYAARAKVLNTISAGIGIASTVAATAKGLQALGGGSAPSGGGFNSSGGGVGSTPVAPRVAFNNTAENQIGQSIAKSKTEQDPIKVVLLESDVTKAQNNVKVLVETNTL